MAQKKWELREEDADMAYRYLRANLAKLFQWSDDIEAEIEAKKTLEDIKRSDYEALKGFIADHLDEGQVKRLRTALRVAKMRRKMRIRGKIPKNITINEDTHTRLASYAKRNNVTLSEAIDRLLELAD